MSSRFNGDIDRVWQVRTVVVLRGQHFNQLRALVGQLLQVIAPYPSRHVDSRSWLARPHTSG